MLQEIHNLIEKMERLIGDNANVSISVDTTNGRDTIVIRTTWPCDYGEPVRCKTRIILDRIGDEMLSLDEFVVYCRKCYKDEKVKHDNAILD